MAEALGHFGPKLETSCEVAPNQRSNQRASRATKTWRIKSLQTATRWPRGEQNTSGLLAAQQQLPESVSSCLGRESVSSVGECI